MLLISKNRPRRTFKIIQEEKLNSSKEDDKESKEPDYGEDEDNLEEEQEKESGEIRRIKNYKIKMQCVKHMHNTVHL
jgi:hypothetical protein